ncbi:hypothetical protein [Novosphingobium subterraneum]|uniref:Uncharacterized protein n=1 Tax=Novosphingobium subterraneum TaxID=48936 RepID=A0A0B9ACB6_9SPHN|nr:hypothetical protein [Novosphingobium subterraneum]KHS48259.1 hypothetical protein NJ75_01448 [Novosphingobium subterraneum]
MPSWIKEQDGLEWYDETYTTKQTNQKKAQLHKKVESGKLRSLPGPDGKPAWYAKPDVELLREAFLKRKQAAKAWKPSDQQLEAKHTREWKADVERDREAHRRNFGYTGALGPGRVSAIGAHQERVMAYDIEQANKKKSGEE